MMYVVMFCVLATDSCSPFKSNGDRVYFNTIEQCLQAEWQSNQSLPPREYRAVCFSTRDWEPVPESHVRNGCDRYPSTSDELKMCQLGRGAMPASAPARRTYDQCKQYPFTSLALSRCLNGQDPEQK